MPSRFLVRADEIATAFRAIEASGRRASTAQTG